MPGDRQRVWLYAVTPGDENPPAVGLNGVGGNAVRRVKTAGVAAYVSDVPDEGFNEAGLRRNLEDLRWLETTAREHHAVIELVAAEGPVVPTRLATVYDSDERLAVGLLERAAELRDALSRLRHAQEWGVRGYAAEPLADTAAEAAGQAVGASPGPGASYLRRRRTQLNARENSRREASASAQAVHACLSDLSAAARVFPPQSPELSKQAATMILNAAYLVPDNCAHEFHKAFSALADEHRSLQLVLTGPWPAYSFVGDSYNGEASE